MSTSLHSDHPENPPRRADESDAAEAALAWALRSGRARQLPQDLAKAVSQARRRRTLRAVMLSSALLLVAGLTWTYRDALPFSAETSPLLASAAQRTLPDGSVVELKERAKIAVEFDAAVRRVRLLAGVAHFNVVKDAQRPFVVETPRITVRAVGTAFLVGDATDAVEVVVTKGVVAVNHQPSQTLLEENTPPAESPAFLHAGNRVVVDKASSAAAPLVVESLSAEDVAAKIAWTIPRIEFSGRRLAEVIHLFNRHSRTQILLAEESLGDLQVSGVLRADSAESLVGLVSMEFGLVAERVSDSELRLRRP